MSCCSYWYVPYMRSLYIYVYVNCRVLVMMSFYKRRMICKHFIVLNLPSNRTDIWLLCCYHAKLSDSTMFKDTYMSGLVYFSLECQK